MQFDRRPFLFVGWAATGPLHKPGNTCRSPIAEAVFIDLVRKAGQLNEWRIDSAAIMPWHVGEPPNPRSCNIFHKYSLHYEHTARQIARQDFYEFDIIFGMDPWNIHDLDVLRPPDSNAQIMLLGHFDPEGVLVMQDPYCVSG